MPLTIRWNRAGEDRHGRDRRPVAAPRAGQDEPWIDLEFRINFLVRAARDGAAAADECRTASCSCISRRSTGSRTIRRCRSPRRPSFAGDLFERLGLLPDARLGRGDVAAQRRAHGRADVHGRSLQGVRRSRAGHPEPASTRATGTCWSASIESTDRVQHMMWRLHRSEASDVRRGAGGASSATRSSASTGAPISSSARSLERDRSGHARARSSRTTASTRGGRRSTSTPGSCSRATWCSAGAGAGREEARRSLRRRRVLGERRLVAARARTRWASARSTSTCAAAKSQRHRQPGRRGEAAGRRAQRQAS